MAQMIANAWAYTMVFVGGSPISTTYAPNGENDLIQVAGPGGESTLTSGGDGDASLGASAIGERP